MYRNGPMGVPKWTSKCTEVVMHECTEEVHPMYRYGHAPNWSYPYDVSLLVCQCPLYRRQSVSCCSCSSVEQSSIACHCCRLFPSSAIVL